MQVLHFRVKLWRYDICYAAFSQHPHARIILVCTLAGPETKRYSMTARPYVTLLKFAFVNKWQIDNVAVGCAFECL